MIKHIISHIKEFISVIGNPAVVVDQDFRIIALNKKYQTLFDVSDTIIGTVWEVDQDFEYIKIPLEVEESGIVYYCYACESDLEAREKEKKKEQELTNALNSALKNGEFICYLQPKMNALTNRIYGAEALVRWISPKWGFVIPGKFISIVEKNGFIKEIDFSILEQVCEMKRRWAEEQAAYQNLIISVNMSRIHFFEVNFADRILEIINKYGVKPSEIELEVTEGVFFENADIIRETIANLKREGFQISIDDFGAGYSSLGMLKDMPVDVLKLDKTFIDTIDVNERAGLIVRNVISMAKDLNMQVIAEGVETEEQKKVVTSYGCEIIQGYFYSKPLSLEEFEIYAETHFEKGDREVYFPFADDMEDKNYHIQGRILGEGVRFEEDSILFPGGSEIMNVLELPHEVLVSSSYTISLWVCPKTYCKWASIFFIRYEKGFMSIVPYINEGNGTFRICDDRREDGWHDMFFVPMKLDTWTHIAVSYDANSGVARFYRNGILEKYLGNVPVLNCIERIIVGGDYYQNSFEGNMKDLVIVSRTRSSEYIIGLYRQGVEKIKGNR